MPSRIPVRRKSERRRAILRGLVAPLACCAALACTPGSAHDLEGELAQDAPDPAAAPAEPGDSQTFHVPPPPFSEGVFPCTDCHDPELPVKTKRRELQMAHEDIVLRHDEEHRWCLDCHDVGNRDVLHLASGESVPFEESHRLCGQCHGDKHRDWRAGVHGRRTGRWDGEKQYLLCVHCHDAHSPKFKPLAPEPAPKRPERTR